MASFHSIVTGRDHPCSIPGPWHLPDDEGNPSVGLRDKLQRKARPGTVRGADGGELAHLTAFATSRTGVEGYVEPETPTTSTTLVLVASDGEWTRRRIASPKAAHDLGRKLGMPVYEVVATGYPSRMREWTAARKAAGEPRAQ